MDLLILWCVILSLKYLSFYTAREILRSYSNFSFISSNISSAPYDNYVHVYTIRLHWQELASYTKTAKTMLWLRTTETNPNWQTDTTCLYLNLLAIGSRLPQMQKQSRPTFVFTNCVQICKPKVHKYKAEIF